MISFYSGTPGSGKSLQMAREVVEWIKKYNKNVIANTRINTKTFMKKKKGGRFYYLSNEKFEPEFFYKYALKFHDLGKEHQSLVVVDEAQCLFSPTAVKLASQENKEYRQQWLEFFTQHRHLGYDIIIISQFDRLIDAQIRCLFEYNCVHRKANNFGFIGSILTILKIPLFVQVTYWYGVNQVCSKKFYTYKKKYSKIYDSYAYRNQIVAKLKNKYGNEQMEQMMGFVRVKKKTEDKKIHRQAINDLENALLK